MKNLCAPIIVAACMSTSQASTVAVSNLGDPLSGTSVVVSTSGFRQDRPLQPFTTGSQSSLLDSIEVRFNTAPTDLVDGGGMTVTLHNDNGAGAPTISTLMTFSGTDAPATNGNHVFSAVPNTMLQANTTYWIALNTDPDIDTLYGIDLGSAPSTALPGWSLGNATSQLWLNESLTGGTTFDRPLTLGINIVPEPSACSLMALGLAAFCRRRRP